MSQQWGSGGGFGGQPGGRPGGQAGPGFPGGQSWGGYRPPQQQPGWQPGWSGAPGGPPRRTRNPLQRVLLVMVGLALVAIVGWVITGLSTGGSGDVAYQNENYQPPPASTDPPPLPEPDTYAEAKTLVSQNAFYNQTVPAPTKCDGYSTIDLTTASDSQLKSHFETMMGCLVAAWHTPVEDAKYTITRPTVTIYGQSITTKCGKSGINAFYCAADQQVYYSNKLAEGVPAVTKSRYGGDLVIAHEFGHLLQARTGILISAHALGQQSGDDATDLQYSRYLETQADCFSGMFLRTAQRSMKITQNDVPDMEAIYVAIGDDTLSGKSNIVGNHGHGTTRRYWGETGLGTDQVGKCNTFAAGPSLTH